MENVNLVTSFVAGIFMFLAPCTLPLVPGFIAFITHGEKERTMRSALMFCLGFLLTFMIFGLLAGLLSFALAPMKAVLEKIGAVFVILLGLYMLGIFNLSFFQGQIFGEKFRNIFKGKHSPFVFGMSIALGWSPCVGPVLAGIFFYAAFSYSVFQALWLFLFFSLGFIIPFLLIAYALKRGKKINLVSSRLFSVLAGILLIFIGLLLLTGDFGILASWAYKAFDFINYEKLNSLL